MVAESIASQGAPNVGVHLDQTTGIYHISHDTPQGPLIPHSGPVAHVIGVDPQMVQQQKEREEEWQRRRAAQRAAGLTDFRAASAMKADEDASAVREG